MCDVNRLLGVSATASVSSSVWKMAWSTARQHAHLPLPTPDSAHSPFSEACFKKSTRNLMTLSPTFSPFLIPSTRSTHRMTSSLNSFSSNSSSSSRFPFFASCTSKQHRSCSFRRFVCSFLWVAVVFCASLKIWHICVRSELPGPSSGTSTAWADVRADDPRVDLVVVVVVVVVVVALRPAVDRADVRPGMFAGNV